MKNLFDLKGKVALVTGASRGLGKAMAKGLANYGAKVMLTDVLEVKEAVEEIRKEGGEVEGRKMNVTKKKDIQRVVKEMVKKWRRIDVLVNNAGIFRMAPLEKMEEKDWDKVIEVNLKGEFLCAQEVGKQMIKQKSGSIINLASVAGKQAFAQSAAYDASKAGVILLTKDLALEWGRYGIRVNALCPGVFATEMTKNFLKDKKFLEMIKRRVPLGRYAQPEELIGAVVYLASEASSYLTGATLVVDGGWTAGL